VAHDQRFFLGDHPDQTTVSPKMSLSGVRKSDIWAVLDWIDQKNLEPTYIASTNTHIRDAD
jgi:hypothetical protein